MIVQALPELLLQLDEDRCSLSSDGRLRAAQGGGKEREVVSVILQPDVTEQGLLLRQASMLHQTDVAPRALSSRLEPASGNDRFVETQRRIGVHLPGQPVVPGLQEVLVRGPAAL